MRMCKGEGCISYALNEHPGSGLCDLCYQKMIVEDALESIETILENITDKTTVKQIEKSLRRTVKILHRK